MDFLKVKKFQKKKEDFICEKCGEKNIGNGFTNHCPTCLYSKHVDINPGDRSNNCKGSMEPIGLEKKGDIFYIVHKCLSCGEEKRNKAEKGDSFNKLIELSKHQK